MMQLDLLAPSPPVVVTVSLEWTTDPVDRTGIAAYTHLIRAEDDPERRPREERQKAMGKAGAALAWKAINAKAAIVTWIEQILLLLSDDKPRTFNAITVTLADITADVAFGGAADDALWSLVASGEAEHTMTAPVLFRRRKAP